MRVKTKQRAKFQMPPCVPDDVKADDVLWEPDRTEILLSNALVRQALFEQEVKRCELEEQKAWLTAAMHRMAVIAVEIDEGLRKAALQEELERNERWWAAGARA
jgi:hypothetical protein